MRSAEERRRFWLFLAVAVIVAAAPILILWFGLGPLGSAAESVIMLFLIALVPAWMWWGIAWVRAARSVAVPQTEARPTFLLPDRYMPHLKIAMLLIPGFFGLVVPGRGDAFWERLLMFLLLFVPIAVVFGLASSRFSIYMREFWFRPRK